MEKCLHLRHALFIMLSKASTGLRGIELAASTRSPETPTLLINRNHEHRFSRMVKDEGSEWE